MSVCVKKRYVDRKSAHAAARKYRKLGLTLAKPYSCRAEECFGMWHLTTKERIRRLGYGDGTRDSQQ